HQTQSLLDTLVGDEAEERRLSKLYRQPLAKRPVEHGVARRVYEIGDDDRVLVREFWCAVKIEVTCGEERQHSRHSRNNHLPAFCDVSRGAGPRTCCHPTRVRVPLQALEIGADFRSVLVAQVAIFFEALVDDAL